MASEKEKEAEALMGSANAAGPTAVMTATGVADDPTTVRRMSRVRQESISASTGCTWSGNQAHVQDLSNTDRNLDKEAEAAADTEPRVIVAPLVSFESPFSSQVWCCTTCVVQFYLTFFLQTIS